MLLALNILAFGVDLLILLVSDANNSFGFCGLCSSGNQTSLISGPSKYVNYVVFKYDTYWQLLRIGYFLSMKSEYGIL